MSTSQAFYDAVRPRERLTPLEWMERHVTVPHSDRNTRFDPKTAPWFAEPINEIGKDANDEIVIAAPVGSGKTTLIESLLCWFVGENPGPTLVTGQTDKTAKQWAESRLAPMFEAVEPVRRLFPRDRHAKRKTEILFSHMPLWIGGANLTSLQEKSIRWCIGDEVWRWEPGMVGELRRRTHDRWNSRVILVSQGGVEGDDFHEAADMAEQREFSWQCRCGVVKPWQWEDIRFEQVIDSEGKTDWNATAASVRMVCPTCKAEYTDDPRTRRALSSCSRYVTTRAGAPGKIFFHYIATAVWWIPWSSLVIEWIKAAQETKHGDQTALRQFMQKRLALRWEERGSGAGDDDVLACRGKYLKGTCPIDSPTMVTLCADPGQDATHWSAAAWSADGQCYVFDYGTVLAPEALLDFETRRWNTPSGQEVRVEVGLVDSGDFTNRIYTLCAQSRGMLLPSKGTAYSFGTWSVGVAKGFEPMQLYTYVDYQAKVALYLEKIHRRKAPFLSFPADADDEFLRGHMGQRLIVPKGGKRKEWRKVATDHYGDCTKLHLVCAWIVRNLFDADPIANDGHERTEEADTPVAAAR